MQFFLDTADLAEIEEGCALGLVNGVTTNPSLMAKTGLKRDDVLKQICDLVKGPVSGEVLSTDFEGMLAEAKDVSQISPYIVVKVPLTEAGLRVVHQLSPEGVAFNVTLCFSTAQALCAAKVGATYISPFLGRLDDIGHEGLDLIADMVELYDRQSFDTQILAASIRHPMHVVHAAKLGADVATMPLSVMKKLIQHPLTDSGLERFLRDAGVLK